MKKLLAIAVFCLPAFGQASYSGLTKYQGGATWQSGAAGGPFTYSARTDACETGLESGCSGLGLPYLGCNAWSSGTYTPVNTTPACPVANGGLAPSVGGLTGAGNIVTLPGFNTQVVRLTDYSFASRSSGPCAGIPSFNNNSSGNFNIIASDDSKVIVQGSGGTSCIFAFNPITMASTMASIGGTGNSTCVSNCTSFDSSASWIFDLTNPNLMWEVVPGTMKFNQLLISACTVAAGTGYCVPGGSSATNVPATYANALNWVYSRTTVIQANAPPGCSGCNPFPPDFVANFSSTLAGDQSGTTIVSAFGDNGQNKPIFGAGPAITAISGSGSIVSVTNNTMSGWTPVVGSPIVIAGVTTTTAYNGNWTVCGTASGCTNPTATAFQYLSTVTGTGAVSSATASYPSATCPTPSGADPLNFAGHYGPIYMFSVTLGAGPGGVPGWRFYDACNGVITGNYGTGIWPSTVTPTDGTCTSSCAADGAQPIGVSGGNPLPDRYFLHGGKSLQNPIYGKISAAVGEASTNPGSCSGGTTPCTDQDIEWELQTTNVRICLALACQGHTTGGYLAGITSPADSVHTWHNPAIPGTKLISSPVAGTWDRHSTYNNDGTLDYQPIFDYPQQVCDVNGTPGSAPTGTQGTVNGPCPNYFATFGTNELIATENSVENPSGAHCLSGGTPVACVYRFGSVYNTGTNFNFNIQNTTPNVDPMGKFVIVASDWNLTLGCTNGWTGTGSQPCLDPISAGNTTAGVITGTSSDGSGHATIMVTNATTFTAGMNVAISGTAESCLNSQNIFVTSTASTTFTGNISGCSSFSNSSDAGTANWKSCGSTPLANAACPRTDLFVYGLLSAH